MSLSDLEILKVQNLQLNETIVTLKKYTNGYNHKRYYEKNKEKYKELGANYLQKLKTDNPEKLKEYRHTAYEKKKLKAQKAKAEAESELIAQF